MKSRVTCVFGLDRDAFVLHPAFRAPVTLFLVPEPADKRRECDALNTSWMRLELPVRILTLLVHREDIYGRAAGSCDMAGENSPATARSCNSHDDAPALRAATICSGSTCAIIIPRETLRCSVAVQASL